MTTTPLPTSEAETMSERDVRSAKRPILKAERAAARGDDAEAVRIDRELLARAARFGIHYCDLYRAAMGEE
jgi:hypothetical protein